jgi:thiol-disulfide isomerase/thioredoxin
MMKLRRLMACGLCAVALCSIFEPWRGVAEAAVTQARRATRSATGKGHVRAGQSRKRSAPLPVVQEINADGLKKILQRDQSQPRPLLINFWATWCGPCREEFPDLVRIGNDYRSRKLDFVLISLDDPSEIKAAVPRYLRRMRARMTAFLLNENEPDSAINAVDPEWAGSMPATFLIDGGGQVVYKHIGPINPEELRTELEKVTSDK